MENDLYRWVLASERLPTKQDYMNTFGLIYKTKSGFPNVKQAKPYFDLHRNTPSDTFYMWLEKIK